ncbi:MAG: hypothetical protein ACTHOU_07005, partial [Aureliella sp.]
MSNHASPKNSASIPSSNATPSDASSPNEPSAGAPAAKADARPAATDLPPTQTPVAGIQMDIKLGDNAGNV